MDGGTVYNIDPISAIEQCLEIVDNEEDIILDVSICYPSDAVASEQEVSKDAFVNLNRGKGISKEWTGTDALTNAYLAYPNVDYRYLFYNTHTAPGAGLDFSNSTTWPLQEQGRLDAQD